MTKSRTISRKVGLKKQRRSFRRSKKTSRKTVVCKKSYTVSVRVSATGDQESGGAGEVCGVCAGGGV